MPAVYEVLKPVTYWGATFEPGALIDQSVIPASGLHRFLVGRYIVEAADRPAAA